MSKCPYGNDRHCETLTCMDCTYDYLMEVGKTQEAAEFYMTWKSTFTKERDVQETLFRGPHDPIKKSSKPKGLPPTEKQLSYIEGLARRQGIPVPLVDTLDEAKAKINELLGTTNSAPKTNEATAAQISYLRSLAYDRLGSSSEQWVQSKISEGRKAVSNAISDLKGKNSAKRSI